MSEFSTGKSMWARMPTIMIRKCAEALALRMAFPDALHGVYTREEMDQAGDREYETPTPLVNQKDITIAPFGESKGKLWSELPREVCEKALNYFVTHESVPYANDYVEHLTKLLDNEIDSVNEDEVVTVGKNEDPYEGLESDTIPEGTDPAFKDFDENGSGM